MRQKWFDVVAAISLAAREHGACMFVPAPLPTGCEHETGLSISHKVVNGSDCFMGAMSRDEANVGNESACLERQA
jgi:hypothetical protein